MKCKKPKKKINWPYPPFIIPKEILKTWRNIGIKGINENKKWNQTLKKLNIKKKKLFDNYLNKKIDKSCFLELKKIKIKLSLSNEKIATRKASNIAINLFEKKIPFLMGGSADLTESNLTKGDNQKTFSSSNYKGTYIYYGIREHAMAGAMSGISLHGGLIPYGGSFLIFTDYCKPSIRLASIMKQRIIYVMTHASIGLGEDGPTHQPIEQLTSLRSVPNLNVLRPADAIETLECWEIALTENTPSIISLTRQDLPIVRKKEISENMSKKGAYVITETKKNYRDITILSTGSEVSIAIEAKKILEKKSLNVTVVSMPSWEIFDKTNDKYKNKILGPIEKRIAIEAASKYGWTKYVLNEKCILGMDNFGASAPGEILYNNFGLNAKEIVKLALRIYKKNNG